ncbi:MAG: DNA starvation/stationary phase protection protein [Proteobacteria bacterium]|nr:DNA starvation/stationary phase protection protein [Pseudomonadota bacterium]
MAKSNKTTVEHLKSVLANTYVLYLKTQNYHWNVTGGNFAALHELFNQQYTEMAAAIDEIAERIRALGSFAPGSFAEFSEFAVISEASAKDKAGANKMVKNLRDDNHTLVGILEKALKAAQAEGDEATVDLFIGRTAAHQKHAWMLDSSIE